MMTSMYACAPLLYSYFYMYIWYYITLLLCTMLLSYFVRNDEIKMFNQSINHDIEIIDISVG